MVLDPIHAAIALLAPEEGHWYIELVRVVVQKGQRRRRRLRLAFERAQCQPLVCVAPRSAASTMSNCLFTSSRSRHVRRWRGALCRDTAYIL